MLNVLTVSFFREQLAKILAMMITSLKMEFALNAQLVVEYEIVRKFARHVLMGI